MQATSGAGECWCVLSVRECEEGWPALGTPPAAARDEVAGRWALMVMADADG